MSQVSSQNKFQWHKNETKAPISLQMSLIHRFIKRNEVSGAWKPTVAIYHQSDTVNSGFLQAELRHNFWPSII